MKNHEVIIVRWTHSAAAGAHRAGEAACTDAPVDMLIRIAIIIAISVGVGFI